MQPKISRPVTWLAITGFMGVGKSRIGRLLAQELMLHFIDLDRYIERQVGLTVAEIFKHRGEAAFRWLESNALKELCAKDFLVVSLGGGTFLDPDNRTRLLQRGPVVALWSNPETIYERVSRRPGKRPQLQGEGLEERIREMLKEREPIYRQAPVQLSTEGLSMPEILGQIVELLWKYADPKHS